QRADVSALVGVVVVAVVAQLDGHLHAAVAAHGVLARGQARAGVRVVLPEVAVLAGLDDRVAADRRRAHVGALVVVDVVAVVARPDAHLDEAVAAHGVLARGQARAGVRVVLPEVPVPAGLDDRVAADRRRAHVGALVVVDVVAVVALLVGSEQAVAAGRQ